MNNEYYFIDPAVEAVAAMDLRQDLLDEGGELLKDAPPEVRAEFRAEMRQFTSLEQLQAVKANKLHKLLADAAAGKAIKEGRYTPIAKSSAVSSTTRDLAMNEALASTVAAANSASAIPAAFREEQQEVCRILGVTLTEAELQQAYRNR